MVACGGDDVGVDDYDVVDVPNTPAERQALGNCWLYAQASWAESMHLRATGEVFDISQTYWTYWHLYDQITGDGVDAITTGGGQKRSNRIVLERGLMRARLRARGRQRRDGVQPERRAARGQPRAPGRGVEVGRGSARRCARS